MEINYVRCPANEFELGVMLKKGHVGKLRRSVFLVASSIKFKFSVSPFLRSRSRHPTTNSFKSPQPKNDDSRECVDTDCGAIRECPRTTTFLDTGTVGTDEQCTEGDGTVYYDPRPGQINTPTTSRKRRPWCCTDGIRENSCIPHTRGRTAAQT